METKQLYTLSGGNFDSLGRERPAETIKHLTGKSSFSVIGEN